jgi:hypothetical protein
MLRRAPATYILMTLEDVQKEATNILPLPKVRPK